MTASVVDDKEKPVERPVWRLDLLFVFFIGWALGIVTMCVAIGLASQVAR